MKRRNPQAEQMADESMLRNLSAQAIAIWPQEEPLFERYTLPPRARIADIGCGSGEITSRLAIRYPLAQIVGVDILESSVAYARDKHAALAPRLHFQQGDAFELSFADAQFDLVVCRHMTQSVPEPEKVLSELVRVCRPGGWLHVLSEDYGMLHMPAGEVDPDRLWREAVIPFAHGTGTDARIGRRTWALLHQLGLQALQVDYIVVDTLRTPRELFARIMQAWRDGYTTSLAEHSRLTVDQVRALFDQVISSILDTRQYAVWHIPIIGGQKPASGEV